MSILSNKKRNFNYHPRTHARQVVLFRLQDAISDHQLRGDIRREAGGGHAESPSINVKQSRTNRYINVEGP